MQPKFHSKNQITAQRFKEICLNDDNKENTRILNDFLRDLFDPDEKLNENSIFITDYLAGGDNYNDFKEKIKQYDKSTVCGLVWNTNYIAYRCRTCGISPCMSLCANCFKEGNHEGHDFNMFRSGAGGACDCGDEHVISKLGFCKFHGPDRETISDAPIELTKCSEIILSNLIYRILQFFRSASSGIHDFKEEINETQSYLEFLNELCSLGTTMRKILAKYMLDSEFYEKKKREEKEIYEKKVAFSSSPLTLASAVPKSSYLHRHFVDRSSDLNKVIRIPDEFKGDGAFVQTKYINMLNELIFWMIKFDFPENLVKFLLSLLPEYDYKIEFTRSFVTHYMYISNQILASESEQLNSRIVHISVQLFSNEAITKIALEQYSLLPIFISTFYNIIKSPTLLKLSPIQDNKQSNAGSLKHYVVDPDNQILQENLYWPAISDLVNLLTHKIVAIKFLEDTTIFNLWLHLLSSFQAMNLNEREIHTHIQYDQPAYFSSFSAELEICSSIFWSFIQHLDNESTLNVSLKYIKLIENFLFKWLETIGLKSTSYTNIIRPNLNQLTFHLPLHRFYSTSLYNCLFKQNAKLVNLLLFDDLHLLDLLAYPLQAQIGYYEVNANMWVRNGLQMRGQAMTYVQNHFSSSYGDPDLFLLQLILCKFNNHELLLNVLFERFYVNEYFRKITSPNSVENKNSDMNKIIKIDNKYEFISLDYNQQYAMLNGLLTFLAQLIVIKPNLELQNRKTTRSEIINILSIGDKSYSQIEDSLPDICSLSTSKRYVESIVQEIADYKQPSFEFHNASLKQGYYVPKDFVWLNEYDPLRVLLRSVKQREYQESFDRYCEFIKSKSLNKELINKLWPPFRLPSLEKNTIDYDLLLLKLNILETKNLHGLFFNLLHKHFNESHLPEKTLYLIIYILELGLYKKKLKNEVISEIIFEESMDSSDIQDNNNNYNMIKYEDWFKSNNILENMCKIIPYINYDEEIIDKNDDNNSTPSFTTSFKSKLFQIPPLKRVCAGLPFFVQSLGTSSNKTVQNDRNKSIVKKKIIIGESIITLLVKILHKYQHKQQSSRTSESENTNNSELSTKPTTSSIALAQPLQVPIFEFKKINESRVGDEYYFISNLLNKAALLSVNCKKSIEDALSQINEKRAVAESDEEEEAKRKKAKAKARQMKLMAQMASHQQAFLSKAKDDQFLDEEMGESKVSTDEDLINSPQKTYDCCICRVSSVANAERPIGVVTLLQSTNVLGYREAKKIKQLSLKNQDQIDTNTVCWKLEEQRYQLLSESFEYKQSHHAVNIGWKGGVFTQTCGHYLHFDCFNSYKETLTVLPQNFTSFISGEYWCPLCRQIANCLLPVMNFTIPQFPKTQLESIHELDKNDEDRIMLSKTLNSSETIFNILQNREILAAEMIPKLTASSIGIEVNVLPMSKISEKEPAYIEPSNFTAAIQSIQSFTPTFRTPNPVQYLCSVLRTQLEITILLKENPEMMVNPNLKRYCFMPLFDVISAHCRLLISNSNDRKIHLKLWSMLTNPNHQLIDDKQNDSTKINCPILLYDPVSILIFLLINLSARVQIGIYRKLINFIFNLVYSQNVLILMSKLSFEQKEKLLDVTQNKKFKDYCKLVNEKIDEFNLCEYLKSNSLKFMNLKPVDENNAAEFVKLLCMPFLKIASLLQSNIYEQEFEFVDSFEDLIEFLQIDYTYEKVKKSSLPYSYLNEILTSWFKDLTIAIKSTSVENINELFEMKSILYECPKLLDLPQLYSELFSSYSQRKCNFCSKVPKEPFVCLICGEHLCYKTSVCCDSMKNLIQEHSSNCGSGVMILLNINSTYIYILRGKRSAAWASLYLDEHGEEDRDLKRGKPIYLSKQRYNVLKALWLSHAFDSQNIRWYNTSLFIQ